MKLKTAYVNADAVTALDALHAIPADIPRDEWVRVGMAAHAAGLRESDFLAWSELCATYNERDARSVWRSFKRGGGVTGATLFFEARRHGWRGDTPAIDAAEREVRRDEQKRERATEAEITRTAHHAAAEAANAVWEASSPATDAHLYLRAKSVQAHGLRVADDDFHARLWSHERGAWINRAIAARKGDLLIPMCDQSGKLWNLQRISANGEKRFLAGGRKSGLFYRFGGNGAAWLAEGYATAASVHAATGAPVVVAFDAGNLPKVADALRSSLQAVAADHDAHGAGQRGAEKTGLPWAMPPSVGDDWNDHAAAHGLDDVHALLATIRLPSFTRPWQLPAVELATRADVWGRQLEKITNPSEAAAVAWAILKRLYMRAPHSLTLDDLCNRVRRHVHPVTLAAMRERLERIIAWRKRRALSAITLSSNVLARHDVQVCDVLPTLTPADYQGVILVQAPMGSGKTQRIGKPFAAWAKTQNTRFVATCHRQSLVSELARVLRVDHYQKVGSDIAWGIDALATCLPSVVKDEHGQIIREAQYLFVDEIAQTIRALAANLQAASKKSRADVFAQLREMVRNARCIIGCDAGMDDRVVRFLEACRPGERFRVIQVPNRNTGLSVRFGYGPDALASAYGEAMARLAQGEKLWISTPEKSRCIEVARVLAGAGHKVLAVHGDNAGNTEQLAFLRAPEIISRDYDAIVHTGVISSGLSVEHRDGYHFDHAMLIASGATVTPSDAMQMMRRVRYVRTWTVAVTINRQHDIDNADAIVSGMQSAARIEHLPADASDFDRLCADIDASEARQRADFAAGLWWGLEHQCFAVEQMALMPADDDMGAELKLLRARLREEQEQAILQADDISDIEAARLQDKPRRTDAENIILLRHRIMRDCGVNALDADTIHAWDGGRGPRQWDRLTAAVYGLVDVRASKGADLSLQRFARACALAYLDLFGDMEPTAGLRITSDSANAIIERVIANRYMLAFLGIVPAKWARDMGEKAFPWPKQPIRDVNEIMERMGLETTRRMNRTKEKMGHTIRVLPIENNTDSVTQSRRIVDTTTWYEVTSDSWQIAYQWATRRNARRQLKRAVPLTIPNPFGTILAAVDRVGSAFRAVMRRTDAVARRLNAEPSDTV